MFFKMIMIYSFEVLHDSLSEADPGFPIGGGQPSRGGHQRLILPNFAKNCLKLRKIWAIGGSLVELISGA